MQKGASAEWKLESNPLCHQGCAFSLFEFVGSLNIRPVSLNFGKHSSEGYSIPKMNYFPTQDLNSCFETSKEVHEMERKWSSDAKAKELIVQQPDSNVTSCM